MTVAMSNGIYIYIYIHKASLVYIYVGQATLCMSCMHNDQKVIAAMLSMVAQSVAK